MELVQNTEIRKLKAEIAEPVRKSEGEPDDNQTVNTSELHSTDAVPAILQLSSLLSTCSYEVIVTDDGSEVTAEAMIKDRFPWASWTAGPRKGPAANRNHGARLAKGDWLVFTDDDCLPVAGWLKSFVSAIHEFPHPIVLEGATSPQGTREYLDEIAPVNESGGMLWSCNMAIKKSFFLILGGFDDAFRYASMEDVDLRKRIEMCSIKPVFVCDARVLHPWRRVSGIASLKLYWASLFVYLSKHPRESRAYHATCHVRFAWNGMRELAASVFKRKWRGAGYHVLKHLMYLVIAARLSLPRMSQGVATNHF
jgi:GT2 family glycosyltransferase